MTSLQHPLTKRIVERLLPGERRTVHWEGGSSAVKGFGCKVEPTGRRVFVFQYDDAGGRTRRITLGPFGAITVEQAREMARQLAAAAARARTDPHAIDPAQARAAAKRNAGAVAAAPTVASLFDSFLANRGHQGAKATTLVEYRRLLGVTTVKLGPRKGEQRIGILRARLGGKRVTDVTKGDIKSLHEAHAGTPAMANRYVVILAACFAYAETEGWIPLHSNPCAHVKRFKVKAERQSLREEEYRALGLALETALTTGLPSAPERRTRARGMSGDRRAKLTGLKRGPYLRADRAPKSQNSTAVAMIRFLALTGWRSSEAKGLRWEEIDVDRGTAVLPDTKSGRSVRPLGKAALALITSLRKGEPPPERTYVFAGSKPGAPIVEIDHVWAAVRHAAQLRITLHGLRHAFTTTARWLGYGDHVIARLVGHVLNDTQTSRYGDVPELQVVEAAHKVSGRIAELLQPEPTRVLQFGHVGSST